MRLKAWGLFFACVFGCSAAWCAVNPTPVSVRGFGMGNACAAVADDSNAMFYNPAGLGALQQFEASAMAGRALSGDDRPQSEMFVLGALPLQRFRESMDYGSAGLFLQSISRPGNDTSTTLHAAFGAALPQIFPRRFIDIPIPEKLLTGMAIRARQINRAGKSNADFGLGVDLGFMYPFAWGSDRFEKGWMAGIAVQELNTATIAEPTLYRFGISWRDDSTVVGMDLDMQGKDVLLLPGIERAFYKNILKARLGTAMLPGNARQLTMGLGIWLSPFQIDLGYGLPLGEPLHNNDRFMVSAVYRFDAPRLGQAVYSTNEDLADRLENKVANLEARDVTLRSSIREKKDTYESILKDIAEKTAEQTAAVNELKKSNARLDTLKKEIEKMEAQIREVEKLKLEKEQRKRERETDAPARSSAPSGPRKHKVAAGDTLQGLAQKYYGDSKKWQVIYEANEARIIRGVPKEGEVLTIP